MSANKAKYGLTRQTVYNKLYTWSKLACQVVNSVASAKSRSALLLSENMKVFVNASLRDNVAPSGLLLSDWLI